MRRSTSIHWHGIVSHILGPSTTPFDKVLDSASYQLPRWPLLRYSGGSAPVALAQSAQLIHPLVPDRSQFDLHVLSVTCCHPGFDLLNLFLAPAMDLPSAGTYWYHSHLSTQYLDGLRGVIVVYVRQ
jgi:hypothetical protein